MEVMVSKTTRFVFTGAIVLAGAIVASALMVKFSPESGWLKFVAWMLFFVSIQTPVFLLGNKQSAGDCTAWLSRFRKKRSFTTEK